MNRDYDTTGLGSRRSKVNTHGLPVDYCIHGSDSMSSFILANIPYEDPRMSRHALVLADPSLGLGSVSRPRITCSESSRVTCVVERSRLAQRHHIVPCCMPRLVCIPYSSVGLETIAGSLIGCRERPAEEIRPRCSLRRGTIVHPRPPYSGRRMNYRTRGRSRRSSAIRRQYTTPTITIIVQLVWDQHT